MSAHRWLPELQSMGCAEGNMPGSKVTLALSQVHYFTSLICTINGWLTGIMHVKDLTQCLAQRDS